MDQKGYLQTGQRTCHNAAGRVIPCAGSGQDAEFKRGISLPEQRFMQRGETVLDSLTGLTWTRNANLAGFPLPWIESLDYVKQMNAEKVFGYADWRLPNRRELRSLMSHQTRKPALPDGHPFSDIFLSWYWTSTSAAINPAFAWYIHMEGARMFYGGKKQFFLLWPVRGKGNGVLPVTGQSECYDSDGLNISCQGTGQDAEFCFGQAWPQRRFEVMKDTVVDHLTNLCWTQKTNLTGGQVTWEEALISIREINKLSHKKIVWRLPNINELESLVDCSAHSPALPAQHPFKDVQDSYWSSTTSMFETDWAWSLYLTKGAVGVGQKKGAHFHVWAVSDTQY